MSICSNPTCKSHNNLWEISSDNKSPPFYIPFVICDKDLQNKNKFNLMRGALINGRLNGVDGDSITWGSFTLKKVVTTWKKEKIECSSCKKMGSICIMTKQIWARIIVEHDDGYPYHITQYVCNAHFMKERGKLEVMVDDEFPMERTWMEKKPAITQSISVSSSSSSSSSSSRKRNKSKDMDDCEHSPKKLRSKDDKDPLVSKIN